MINRSIIFQLFISWLFYNTALAVVLWITCVCFDQNEYETVISMAVISVGISIMQYDWWALNNGVYKVRKYAVRGPERRGHGVG